MSIYAVTYLYPDQADKLAEHRPAHRAFLSGLYAAKALLASGPVSSGDVRGALLIVQADSEQGALDLLATDPFSVNDLLAEKTVVKWDVIYGPWAE